MNNLIEIHELKPLLGYKDVRAVQVFCRKNKIPVFRIGRKTYAVKNFLSMLVHDEMKKFVEAHYENPEAVLSAIEADDKAEFAMLMKGSLDERARIKVKKNVPSKAALDFLKNIS